MHRPDWDPGEGNSSSVLLSASLYFIWARVSVRFGECFILSLLSAGLKEMAEYEAAGERPQRRLSVKEEQNGELTGKNKKHRLNPCLKMLY